MTTANDTLASEFWSEESEKLQSSLYRIFLDAVEKAEIEFDHIAQHQLAQINVDFAQDFKIPDRTSTIADALKMALSEVQGYWEGAE